MPVPNERKDNMNNSTSNDFMTVLESVAPLIDAAARYRRRSIDAGFTERTAEAMALSWHQMVIQKITHDLLSDIEIEDEDEMVAVDEPMPDGLSPEGILELFRKLTGTGESDY